LQGAGRFTNCSPGLRLSAGITVVTGGGNIISSSQNITGEKKEKKEKKYGEELQENAFLGKRRKFVHIIRIE